MLFKKSDNFISLTARRLPKTMFATMTN